MPADARGLRVALGDRRYRVERPFGSWPSTGGVVTDVTANDRGVVVLLRYDPLAGPNGPAVVVLRHQDGVPLASWGDAIVADAHKIAASGGRLYIVDRDAHQVLVTSPDGEVLMTLGVRHAPLEPFNHPTDVAVGPDGSIYVSDGYAGTTIHRFSAEGRPIASWGGFGVEPGQFVNPHGLWVMRDGRVVVADRENGRLQVFDGDGILLAVWPGFHRPADIWGDAQDRLYVVDAVPSLTCLDPDGRVIGRCRPVLNGAHGLWGDEDGCLYLAESSPSRITRLVPETS